MYCCVFLGSVPIPGVSSGVEVRVTPSIIVLVEGASAALGN